MTRSSSNELFTPYKDPEREFRSSRRHFKTLSLDELRSPDFNLLSDQEYSKEEVMETMAETMEQYLSAIPSKTVVDAKIVIQEMAEYSQKWHNGTSKSRSTKTSNGLAAIQAQLNNLRIESKKVNEKVYAAQVGCKQCKGPHYIKYYPLKEEGKILEEAYYTQSMEDILSKSMSESTKTHEENSNLIKEIQASMDVVERGFRSLPSSTKANPRDQVKSILTTIEVNSCPIRRIGSSQYDKDYFKGREEKIVFKSVKPASSLIKRVYMLCLRERIELDLEARLMGETLVLNRSLDPFFEDYIKLNDLNEPIKLRRNQGDDLMPTIKEGKVIEEFRIRDDEFDDGIDDYPSYCN
nr:hypothetical protein [Tanacetum cinerariifolium]